MNKLEYSQFELNKVKAMHMSLQFPALITELRRAIGTTRKTASTEMGLPYMRLLNLEAGSFKRTPEEDELKKIADYFDFPLDILSRKAKEHAFSVRFSDILEDEPQEAMQ